MYAEGVRPAAVPHRPLPDSEPPSVHQVYADLLMLAGMAKRQGYDGSVVYATSYPGTRRTLPLDLSKGAVSEALRRLRTRGCIEIAKTLTPRRKDGQRLPDGTRVYRISPPRRRRATELQVVA